MESDVVIVGDGEVVKVVGAWETRDCGMQEGGSGGGLVISHYVGNVGNAIDFSFYLYDVVLFRNLSSQHTV